MKKLFGWIFGIMFLVSPVLGGSAYCAGVENPVVSEFFDEVWSKRDQFVFDEENRERLTSDFDDTHPGMTLPQRNESYHTEISGQLARGEKVRMSCRALSGWAKVELHNRGVECKEITIVKKGGHRTPFIHVALLVPCGVGDVKDWRVYDISEMTRFMLPGMESPFHRPKDFLGASVKQYMMDCDVNLLGIFVNYDNFVDGVDSGHMGGRDISAWLATEGGDRDLAKVLLCRSPLFGGAVFLSIGDHVAEDERIVLELRDEVRSATGFECRIKSASRGRII